MIVASFCSWGSHSNDRASCIMHPIQWVFLSFYLAEENMELAPEGS